MPYCVNLACTLAEVETAGGGLTAARVLAGIPGCEGLQMCEGLESFRVRGFQGHVCLNCLNQICRNCSSSFPNRSTGNS